MCYVCLSNDASWLPGSPLSTILGRYHVIKIADGRMVHLLILYTGPTLSMLTAASGKLADCRGQNRCMHVQYAAIQQVSFAKPHMHAFLT